MSTNKRNPSSQLDNKSLGSKKPQSKYDDGENVDRSQYSKKSNKKEEEMKGKRSNDEEEEEKEEEENELSQEEEDNQVDNSQNQSKDYSNMKGDNNNSNNNNANRSQNKIPTNTQNSDNKINNGPEKVTSARAFLEETVTAVVQQGMLELTRIRPPNPLEFLGNFILDRAKETNKGGAGSNNQKPSNTKKK